MINKAAMDEIIYRYGWLRARFPFLFRNPLGYFFYITGKCNLDCHYCWQRDEIHSDGNLANSSTDTMTPDQWVRVVKKLPRHVFLGLSGGEVTMSPALGPIIASARGSNPVTINTNAANLREEHVELLTDRAVKNISVSLDGFEDIHDKSRSRAGLFKKVVSNIGKINRARKNGKPMLTIKTVLLNENIERLEEFRDFCAKELMADVLNLSFQKTGEHSQFSFLCYDDLDELLKNSRPDLFHYENHELIVRTLGAMLDANRRSKLKTVIYPRMKNAGEISSFLWNRGRKVLKPCYLPLSMVVVLPNGEVIPCLSFGLGNVKETGYDIRNLLKKSKYKRFCDRLLSFGPNQPDACNTCCFATVDGKLTTP